MLKIAFVSINFKNRFRSCSLFLIWFLCLYQIHAQVPINSFNEKEEKYFETVINLTRHLKSQKTTALVFHETEKYEQGKKFYDEIIDKYFAKQKMIMQFQKDTTVLAVEGKIDLVRHVLNVCDIQLDVLSKESILIGSNHSDINSNSLNIFLNKNGSKNLVLVCEFDKETYKLLGFSLIGNEKE